MAAPVDNKRMSLRRVTIKSKTRTVVAEIHRLRATTKGHPKGHRCYFCDRLNRLCEEMRKREMSHASQALVDEFLRP